MWEYTRRRFWVLALIALLVLSTTGTVQADLKANNAVYAWDEIPSQVGFRNSMVEVYFDGGYVSFLHRLNFDNDLFDTTPYYAGVVCGQSGLTQFAGLMEYGVYHEDNDPLGADGFRSTQNWSLVYCDRDNDGDFDGADLDLAPQELQRPFPYGDLVVILPDDPRSCTTGNCDLEIVTTLFINLDTDCDGVQDVDPGGGVCFYAEAETPQTSYPFWKGNPQGRISAGGGDTTVNFSPSPDPTAVNLASFQAIAGDAEVTIAWETADEIDVTGFNLWRSTQNTGPDLKLNETPIAALSPGSLTGNSYSYRDDTVAPGITYYYWLQALEVGGGSAWHGPVSALVEAAPSAVRLQGFAVSRPVTTLGGTLLLALGATGLVLVWRRRRP